MPLQRKSDMTLTIAVNETIRMIAHKRSGIRNLLLVLVLSLLLCASMLTQCWPQQKVDEAVIPIAEEVCGDMKLHKVLPPGAPVGCERLREVKFDYIGFDGQLKADGEIVVMDAVADHVLQIFDTLRDRHFPIAKARLMDRYDGDDEASMADNNTSSFNVRKITGGGPISMHALGLAIDINPMQNPYIKCSRGLFTISPKFAAAYVDRNSLRPGMAEEIIDVFANHGFFTWGGDWENPIDYQHFQVSRNLADQLLRLSSANARALFERYVENCRTCRQAAAAKADTDRRSCIANPPTDVLQDSFRDP